ncbi:hypothetical protein D3C87_1596090 [compost metagenome]
MPMVSAAMVPNSAPASPATTIPAIHSCMCPRICGKACNEGICGNSTALHIPTIAAIKP